TTLMGLVAQACSAPLDFLPLLKRLFEAAKRDVVTYPYLTIIANVAMNVLERDPTLDEMFVFFVYAIEVCQEYYAKYPQALRSRSYRAPEALQLGPYIYLQYHRTGSVRSTWFETR